MVRLSRTQQQERTRETVLAAAREEFAEFSFAEAKIDRIAERAELTRGAVYSNFPSKRALYLAVLLNNDEPAAAAEGGTGLQSTLEAFARVWLERLPLISDSNAGAALRMRSLAGVFDGERGRAVLDAVGRLESLLLALALEDRTTSGRRMRLAGLVLTLLDGACARGGVAPGSVDPFDVARACGHLAALELHDAWNPPHREFVTPATTVNEPWNPPAGLLDLITGRPLFPATDAPAGNDTPGNDTPGIIQRDDPSRAGAPNAEQGGAPSAEQGGTPSAERGGAPGDQANAARDGERGAGPGDDHREDDRRVAGGAGGDGLVLVLGAHRLGAAEEAVRAGGPVTVAIVTTEPAELGALIRLRVRDLASAVRRVMPDGTWPPFRLVLDETGAVARALDVPLDDTTEAGIRVAGDRIVARADGRGAALALEAHR